MSKAYSYAKQFLFYLLIIVYVLLLAKVLLFKNVSPSNLFDAERTITRAFNVIPFKTIHQYLGTHFNIWIALLNVIGNIAIFIPLGMYLQVFMRNKKVWCGVALACAISFSVEAVQYILGIGAADIDDIILNTIGGLTGILIYKAMYWVLKDENKMKTAIVCLWGFVAACFLLFMVYITFFTNMKIRLF